MNAQQNIGKIWICPKCSEELGEYNAYCEYCKQSDNIIVYNPDKYYIREIRLRHLVVERSEMMTPQEELFANLFNGYKTKPSVNAMTDIELRSHREELCRIALEAKACIYAVDDILKERRPKGVAGFSRSVGTDETTTDAINTIKDRQKRLTKNEKLLASLQKLGINPADAAKLMTEGALLARTKDRVEAENKQSVEGSETSVEASETLESKKIINPFAK